MTRSAAFCLFCLISLSPANAQRSTPPVSGRYVLRYGCTELKLFPDSTFLLETPDDVFTYTFDTYTTRGRWTAAGNVVTLNPGLAKRSPRVSMMQRHTGHMDSITVRIDYSLEVYRHDSLAAVDPADFNMLTLFWNSSRHYRTLVRQPVIRHCSFAHPVRHQLIVDSSNTVRLPKEKLTWLGIYSYGFGRIIRLPVTDPASDYFEVHVVLPVDEERTPRSKTVIIRHKKAYYFEYDGKVWTSIFAPALERRAG